MRIAIASIGVISAVAGWPVLTALSILVLSIRYRAYEAPFIGLFTDLLWQGSAWHLPYFTIGALAVFWLFEPLRTEFLK